MTRSIPLQVAVSPEAITAAPEETVSLALSVFNTSDIIDGFDITVIGADREWVRTDPDWISLFPDTEGTVDVALTLPADFPAGRHDVSIKVTSRTTDEVFAVSRVSLDVTDQRAATLELDPDARTGGRKGRFAVRLRNTGNVPVDLGLDAEDDTGRGRYQLTPSRMILDPGEARTSQLVVTMPRPFTGIAVPKPFIVTGTGTGLTLTAPGTYTPKPWIPRWLLMVLGVLGLLAVWALIVGAALDAVMDDSRDDIATAFEEGIAAALGPDAGGPAAADVVAGQPGIVPGMVVSSLDGQPVVGATVTALALFTDGSNAGQVDPDRDPIEVATGDDGSFAFEEMIRGTYQVVASGTGYVPSEPLTVEVPFEADPLVLEVTGEPGLIAGITLHEGEPVESIAVLVRRLDPASGAAIDIDGNPTEEPMLSTVTTTTGRFSLADLPTPATYEVEASGPGYTPVRLSVDLTAGQQLIGIELELVTQGVATVTGTVRHGVTGEALGGVSVTLSGDAGTFNTTTLTAQSGLGTYTLEGVPEGSFTTTFTLEGFSDVALPLNLSAESPSAVLNASMFPAPTAPIGSVSGRVTTASGSGLGGVTITISGEGGTFATASLTVNGQVGDYSATGLPAGSYTATFTLPGYTTVARAVTVTATEPDVTVNTTMATLPVTPTGSVTGTVTDGATSNGLGGVTVTLTGGGATYSTTTITGNGSAGTYTLDDLPLGAYTATFTLANYENAAVSVTLTGGEPDATADATMVPIPTRVTGRVVQWGGEGGTFPMGPGIPVSYNGTQVGVTNADSVFDLLIRAPIGTATLEIGDGVTWFVVRPEVVIVPGETTDIGDVYGFFIGDAEITITDALGRTFAGNAQATIEAADIFPFPEGFDLDSLTRTRAVSGTFTLTGLPTPASYQFELTLPSFAAIPETFRGVLPVSSQFWFDTWNTGETTEVNTSTTFYNGVVHGIVYCGNAPAPNTTLMLGYFDESTLANYIVLETATTDAQGRYAFRRPFPVGSWPVSDFIVALGTDGPFIGAIEGFPGTFPYYQDFFICE